MSYIGKTPQVGSYVKLDAITCSSTNTYNLAQDSVAFTPESALHMMVSLNGVIQAPLSSFSVSGSTITFLPSSGTLSSSDTIDFILVLGNVLDIGTPSDSTVTNAKTNFVSSSSSAGLSIKGDGTSSGTGGKLQLNCSANSHGIKLESPAHSAGQGYTLKFPTGNVTADKFLKVASITGSGTTGVGQLSFADAGGGKVLQVKQANSGVSVATTSTSYVTSGIAINITPVATSSKVLLTASIGGFYMLTNDDLYATIYKGSTNLGVGNASSLFYVHNDGGQNRYGNGSMEFLDSPNTASQVTYTIYFRTGNSQQVELNRPETGLFFTAIEIGA